MRKLWVFVLWVLMTRLLAATSLLLNSTICPTHTTTSSIIISFTYNKTTTCHRNRQGEREWGVGRIWSMRITKLLKLHTKWSLRCEGSFRSNLSWVHLLCSGANHHERQRKNVEDKRSSDKKTFSHEVKGADDYVHFRGYLSIWDGFPWPEYSFISSCFLKVYR